MFKLCVKIWRAYQTATTTVKMVVWLAAGGFATVTAIVAEWAAVLLIIGSLALVVAIFGAIVFVSLPIGNGKHTPRYLIWYKNPLRRMSFDFDNYLGMNAREGKNLRLGRFQARIRVNRGKDLEPIDAFIQSLNSGKKSKIRFRALKGYKEASDVELIPKGRDFIIAADFDDLKKPGETIPIEDFLKEFSGFKLIIRWDNKIFSRTFPRSEIEAVIESFRRYSNPEPPRQIVLRNQSD